MVATVCGGDIGVLMVTMACETGPENRGKNSESNSGAGEGSAVFSAVT